jgi:hypothetical protein
MKEGGVRKEEGNIFKNDKKDKILIKIKEI